jgi:rhodanese-related sulfurtransferase
MADEKILEALKKFVKSTDKDWNYVTPVDFEKMDKNDLFLLDIRKPEDYKKEHIKGARNIFWLDLLDNLDELPDDKKIVLICYVGHTSSQALVILKLLGYDVVSLKFGMGRSPVEGVPVAGWLDYGFETVKGREAMNRYDKIASRICILQGI